MPVLKNFRNLSDLMLKPFLSNIDCNLKIAPSYLLCEFTRAKKEYQLFSNYCNYSAAVLK